MALQVGGARDGTLDEGGEVGGRLFPLAEARVFFFPPALFVEAGREVKRGGRRGVRRIFSEFSEFSIKFEI
jgi:hypothetical protein